MHPYRLIMEFIHLVIVISSEGNFIKNLTRYIFSTIIYKYHILNMKRLN